MVVTSDTLIWLGQVKCSGNCGYISRKIQVADKQVNDSEPTTLAIAFDTMVNSENMLIVLGVIGNVTSFFVFASLLPTIWRIWKNKSVDEFKYHPLAVGIIHSIMWVFYSMPFVHPHSIPVTTVNSVGLVMYIIFNIIYYVNTNKTTRRSMVLHYIAEFVFLAGLVWSTLVTFDSHATRSGYVGFFCVFFGIILYGLDLGITVKAIRAKNVKSRLLLYSLVCFLNGLVWSVYALVKYDPYILIENSLGALIGCIQFLLYIGYYCVERFRTIKLSPVDDC
ncbi:bidirectional sugar transporter SWEET5 isoform X1 [Spinacia oleracea]|uniref:Bidirectional sugar transporter SWEET n=2 Tax=Spinacia oleracea TaxID=3562 RepID=A0A9R0I5E5_SPIOL|nr:bidirectional sugar transporter SWEET5-like isoform X1 [Spinacia oleracea]